MKTIQNINISIFLLFFLLTTLNISCESKSKNNHKTKSDEYLPVKKVVDGDTFWAENGTKTGIKVRLIGIDAPESRNVFKKKIGYYGREAKQYLIQLISDKDVKLVFDIDSLDQYGRTLAYVYLKDGTFVNAELIKNGYAQIMTIPPNVRFAGEFLKFQQEARNNNLGLWNTSNQW